MKPRFVSVIAKVDGVDREIVAKRQSCDGWIETEGDDIVFHLTGPAIGPILMYGTNPRLAIFHSATSTHPIAAFDIVQPIAVGDHVPLS